MHIEREACFLLHICAGTEGTWVKVFAHASELSKNHVTGTQSVSASTGTSAAFIALRPSSYF